MDPVPVRVEERVRTPLTESEVTLRGQLVLICELTRRPRKEKVLSVLFETKMSE